MNNDIPSCVAQSAFRISLLTVALAFPALSHASNWVADPATPSLFGTDANWDPSGVPAGVPANIFNGGTAQVTTGDVFGVASLNLGGNSGTGGLTQSDGTVVVDQLVVGGDNNFGGTGSGTLTMTGGNILGSAGQEWWIGSRGGTGTLTMSGNSSLANSNWIIFGRDTGGTGNATLSGTSSIDKTGGGNIAIAVFTATTSTVTMSDHASMTSNNEIRIGWGNNSATTKGVLNMSGDSTITAGGNIQVALREGGGTAGPTGELHMSGNAIASAGNEFYVGSAATSNGTLTMDGSSKINVTNGFVVGRFDSTGVATINGNSEVAIGGFNVVGDGPPAVGTLVVNDNANVHSNFQLWLGLNDSDSTVTINGGLVHASAALDAGGNTDPTGAGVSFSRVVITTGGSGTLNLNGGVLETPGFSKYGGTVAINLNGGTIKATGMTTTGSFFDSIANSEINIQAGGAKFDTNGNAITVVQNLSGVGGLTKQGLGTMTLSGMPVYLGDTRVEGGTLSLSLAGLSDTANVYLTSGAFFDLSTNTTDTIGALVIDGQVQAVGTWGAVGSGADHTTALITGNGMLNVTTTVVPEPSTIALLMGGVGLLLVLNARGGRALKRRRAAS